MPALVLVQQPNVFTCNPDLTASMLFTVIKKIGGSIELTVEEMNADFVKDGEETDATMTLVREELEFDEDGGPTRVRLAVVPLSRAKEIAEEQTNREIVEALRKDGVFDSLGAKGGAKAFIDRMNQIGDDE